MKFFTKPTVFLLHNLKREFVNGINGECGRKKWPQLFSGEIIFQNIVKLCICTFECKKSGTTLAWQNDNQER